MKTLVIMISILVAWLLSGVVGGTFLILGGSFIFTVIKEYAEQEEWSVVIGSICYTIMIIALTLIVRWAFT